MVKNLGLVLGTIVIAGIVFFSLGTPQMSTPVYKPAEQLIPQDTLHVTFQSKMELSQIVRQTNPIENSNNTNLLIQKANAITSDQSTLLDTKFIFQNESKYNDTSDNSVEKFRDSLETFYGDSLPVANAVSEKYIHDTLGFEFLIPSGWYAMQGSNPNRVLFMPTNQTMTNETHDFVIAMSIRNLSESATPSESLYNDCVNVLSYKIMNETPVREKSSTCNDHNYKAYSFVKDKKIITIAYITLPPGDEFKEKDFEKLVSTLKVDNPSPIMDTWRQANGFQIYNKKFSEDNLKFEVKYYTVSQVDEFTIDLKNKQIMVTVNESDNVGSIIIPISELFVEPYTTTVDGSNQDVVLIDDKTTGITEIFVPYKKGTHTIKISGNEIVSTLASKSGGGCLIATAAYGSELAPQVQQLRELRDNHLLQTESGKSFMSSFNEWYYSFSPIIADWERENPAFKEFVKISLTPLISSLSILNYVDMDSEESVLGYGISLILLNVGMYFVAPGIVIYSIRRQF